MPRNNPRKFQKKRRKATRSRRYKRTMEAAKLHISMQELMTRKLAKAEQERIASANFPKQAREFEARHNENPSGPQAYGLG